MIKSVSKTIKNEAKEQKVEFLGMLLGTLGASLLENRFAGKGGKRQKPSNILGKGVMRAGEGTIRADEVAIRVGQDFSCRLIV